MKLTVDDDGDTLTFAMADDDVPAAENAIAMAYRGVLEAIEEEAKAKASVIRFARFAGPAVWLNRHPLDIEKVDRLRRSRWRLRGARLNLDYAMRCEPAEGMA